MSRFFEEEVIKNCIVPLDEIMSKFALVPMGVVVEVLANQGLFVVNEDQMRVLYAMEAVPDHNLVQWTTEDYPNDTTRYPAETELTRRKNRK